MKLSRALQGYWLDKKLDFSPHTVTGYEVIFKRLVEFLGDVEFSGITSNDVREFLIYVADEYGLSKKSLSNVWIALSSLWSWGTVELNTPHIIKDKIKRPKFTEKKIVPLEKDEIKRLIAACDYSKAYMIKGKRVRNRRPTADRDRAIILVLLDCGIRSSELCDLRISDYDERRGRLHIRHGKNDKERHVPLGNRARKGLWKYLANRPDARPSQPLFATKTNEHLNRVNLGNLLEVLGKNAGVDSVHPHKLRHTFATEFLRNGGNVLLLKEILGHETLEMVMRYAEISQQDLDASVTHSPADNWHV